MLCVLVGASLAVSFVGTVGALGADNDPLEPNDSMENASPVSDGDSYDLRIAQGDEDYFAIDTERGQQIDVSIQFSDDAADIDMALLSPDGSEVAQSVSVSDDERITHTATQTGTYYVRVYPWAGAPADYSFSISLGEGEQLPEQDRFEPNDGVDSAVSVSPGDSFDGLSISEGDEDYFAVDVESGQEIDALIAFSDDVADVDMALLSPSGSEVAVSNSVSDDERIIHTASQSGTYYVRVYHYSGGPAEYDFAISLGEGQLPQDGTESPVSAETLPEDRLEANDAIESAVPVSHGDELSQLSITRNDVDLFEVQLAPGQEVTVDMFHDHSEADLDLVLLDSSGNSVDRSVSTSDDEHISYTSEMGGTYYVRAYPYSGAPANYSLSVTLDPAPTPTPTSAPLGDGEGGSGDGSDGGDGGDGAFGPGFGPLVAVLALIAVALLARRRQ